MSNPFAKFGISEEELLSTAEVDEGLNAFMEDEVVPEWKSNSPVGETREYIDSVQVTQRAHGGRGQVGAMSPIANLIEDGSIHNEAFEPRAKTEAHFLGDSSGIVYDNSQIDGL
jgi:hypothetical protein